MARYDPTAPARRRRRCCCWRTEGTANEPLSPAAAATTTPVAPPTAPMPAPSAAAVTGGVTGDRPAAAACPPVAHSTGAPSATPVPYLRTFVSAQRVANQPVATSSRARPKRPDTRAPVTARPLPPPPLPGAAAAPVVRPHVTWTKMLFPVAVGPRRYSSAALTVRVPLALR